MQVDDDIVLDIFRFSNCNYDTTFARLKQVEGLRLGPAPADSKKQAGDFIPFVPKNGGGAGAAAGAAAEAGEEGEVSKEIDELIDSILTQALDNPQKNVSQGLSVIFYCRSSDNPTHSQNLCCLAFAVCCVVVCRGAV